MNNTLKYVSPVLGGFSTEMAYGFGEAEGSTSIGRQIGGSLGYTNGTNGSLTIKLAHHNTKDAASKSGKVTWVAAKYDFDVFTRVRQSHDQYRLASVRLDQQGLD